jgi:[acyl-carrier-protein] S-malonyltransferase
MINLQDRLSNAAFVFRGYNVTNLGRSQELLAHHAYGPIVEHYLQEASQVASEMLNRKVDLVARVERGEETDLETYGDAVALIIGIEQAQLRLMEEFFDIDYAKARLSFGYSLGEIGALVAGGVT